MASDNLTVIGMANALSMIEDPEIICSGASPNAAVIAQQFVADEVTYVLRDGTRDGGSNGESDSKSRSCLQSVNRS
jgi:hypothetical protein